MLRTRSQISTAVSSTDEKITTKSRLFLQRAGQVVLAAFVKLEGFG